MGFGRAADVFTGDSGKTVSVWMSSPGPPEPGSIEKDLATDVCVVGGGIAGLTTAYLLAREGRSVVLLDDGPLGGGETCRTTAHLSNVLDDRYAHLAKVRGEDGARLAAESHTAAIDRIEKIILEERISCGFERLDGYLFNPRDDRQENLAEEREAARLAGLAGVELLDRAPLPSFDTGPCLRFPRQAQFHPLRYLGALARAIPRDGGLLFTGSHVESVEGGNSQRVVTSRGPVVTARSVVVATNSPINTGLAIHAKQAAYRTYAIAGAVPRGSVPRALYWDTGSPYHYVRLHSDEDGEELLIVGGEDHKTGQEERPQERLARLETWARERFPEMGSVAYRWSGQVIETMDGLAFIGPSPDGGQNVYVATGDSGMGMTHGTIAGILLTDLIGGRKSPWAELYDPSRKPLRAVGEVLRENLNVALQYADRAAPADVGDAAEVPRGAGAVLRRGARQVAVYRDPDGAVHEMSAVCPHLGCVVSWNSLESSWDCPCHGSRFDAHGRVINGPAAGDIPPAQG